MAGTSQHPITIEPAGVIVTVNSQGMTLAHSAAAQMLREASYDPVLYVPRPDIDMRLLRQNSRVTRCPFKGECCYFDLVIDGQVIENVAWSYQEPFADVAEIAGHLAFYPDKAEIIAPHASG